MSYEKVDNITEKLSTEAKKFVGCGVETTKKVSHFYDRLPNPVRKAIVGTSIFMAGMAASDIKTNNQYGEYPDGHFGSTLVVNNAGKTTAWLGVALLASLSAETKKKLYNNSFNFGKDRD